MKKVILKGYIIVPEADLTIVKMELPRHIELTKNEEGCITFEVIQDKLNLNKFTVYEEFDSLESFEKHQNRVKESTWGEVTKSVERHYKLIK